ncbi:MAG TPA: hypothetical protein VN285_12355 [Candidatus Deferrimicrobium sp.]|nr:hypothetical protein [Candidatus Deferrimicrobium sp.]
MTNERSETVKRRERTFVALPGHISVLLLSNSGLVPLSNLTYRIHVSSDRILEGTTDRDGLISHPDVPVGEYRTELQGMSGEVTIPSTPVEIERYPLRVAGYMLFADDTPEESLPNIDENQDISLGQVEEEDWEDLPDE